MVDFLLNMLLFSKLIFQVNIHTHIINNRGFFFAQLGIIEPMCINIDYRFIQLLLFRIKIKLLIFTTKERNSLLLLFHNHLLLFRVDIRF